MANESATASVAIPGDRGPAVVSGRRSLQSRVQNLLAIGVVALVGGGFLSWYYLGLAESREAAKRKPPAVVSEVKLPPLGPAPPRTRPAESTSMVEEDSEAAAELLAPAVKPDDAWAGAASDAPGGASPFAAPVPPDPVLQRKLEAPVLVRFLAEGGDPAERGDVRPADALDGSQANRPGSGLAGGNAGGEAAGASALVGLLRPTVVAATAAGVLPDRHWLLPKGAFIDCTLETAIDSTLPGMTTCVTATDVWSADGSVVLMERGTKLVGETRGGLAQGQRRLFVLWSEARTPAGVSVSLDSPGTDALGRSGVTGDVDTHFAARFGAAILISLIDAGAAAVVAAQSEGGGGVVIAPQGASDVMSEVLRSTVNIPPTIRVPQGERVSVLVARDVSFHEVYALERG
jgi:type IV secretion system protein VirB10